MLFDWTGEAFTPKRPKLADKYFVVGESYRLVVEEERSSRSHAHFFAALNDAHSNLPEHLTESFPTVDHLRRWALVRAGYADERSVACDSDQEAQRVAAFVKPIDGYAVVLVSGSTVRVFTAKSQSVRAMGAEEFQKSKNAVLDIVADLIGVDPATLSSEAGQAA